MRAALYSCVSTDHREQLAPTVCPYGSLEAAPLLVMVDYRRRISNSFTLWGSSARSKLAKASPVSSGVRHITVVRNTLIGSVLRFATGLRFPTLFAIAGALFLLDLLIPDLIPFADELLLGLVTLMLGSLKRRKPPPNS